MKYLLVFFIFIHFLSFSQTSVKPGNIMKVIVQTPTPKLESSIEFYKKLNFKQLPKPVSTDPLQLNNEFFTDGKMIVEINPDKTARAGLKLFKKSWAAEIPKLEALTKVFKTKGGYMLYDPSGIVLYLVESEFKIDFTPADSAFSHLGNYQGLTVESADIAKAFTIYEILGFQKNMGDAAKGFVGLQSEDNFAVTLLAPLMCPHLFFNPSVTYFNGKNNPAVIKKIRELNIPITEEIGVFNKEAVVDNVIIRDPGGFGFFIFND